MPNVRAAPREEVALRRILCLDSLFGAARPAALRVAPPIINAHRIKMMRMSMTLLVVCWRCTGEGMGIAAAGACVVVSGECRPLARRDVEQMLIGNSK